MSYRNLQNLYKKIETFLTYIVSIQRTSRILKIGTALSKWPHFHSAYVIGVYIFFATAVFMSIFPLLLLMKWLINYCKKNASLSFWFLKYLLHKIESESLPIVCFALTNFSHMGAQVLQTFKHSQLCKSTAKKVK